MNLHAIEWFKPRGRYPIAVIDTREAPSGVIRTDDTVTIDGGSYTVQGIEQTRALTEPPTISPYVAISVTPND